MLKVFNFFKFQFQFDNYEVTGVWIQCNRCNKTSTCQFYLKMLIEFLLVFIKDVLFRHAGLSLTIENNYQYK